MIVAEIGQLTGEEMDEDLSRSGERIKALVAAGKLESQGDLSRWRYSEVRLPAITD